MTLDNLTLSLDTSTSNLAAGRRKLRNIDSGGALHYTEGNDSGVQLAENLERIWSAYPGGLHDLKEEELEVRPPDQVGTGSEPAEEDTESLEGNRYEMMTAEIMELLRSDIFVQLNDARNELWFVLELAKTLAESSSFTITPPGGIPTTNTKKGAKAKPKVDGATVKSAMGQQASIEQPPILPPGALSATFSMSLETPLQEGLCDLELALAARQEAVENCSTLIDTAVAELQTMAAAGHRFWRDVRSLEDGERMRGQWAIVPRPDFGRSMKEGDNASDIIIPYALDEASAALRARSLAAFDLDPNREDFLTFGARTHLNLRVTLNTGTETASSTRKSWSTHMSDVRQVMEAAQLEAFDEELFNELRHEASAFNGINTALRMLTIPMGEGELRFELYDARSALPSLMSSSAPCDLILHAARLLLLQVHKSRKRRLIERLAPVGSTSPVILRSLLSALHHHSTYSKVLSTLSIFKSVALQGGINSRIVAGYTGITNLCEGVVRLLQTTNSDLDFGDTISLELEGCRGIICRLTALSEIQLTTSRASFVVAEITELPAIIAGDLENQLLAFAADHLHDVNADESKREQVFLNGLEGEINLPRRGIIRVFMPAPYDAVHANFRSTAENLAVDPFDSRKRQDFKHWLRQVSNAVFSEKLAE